MGPQNSKLRDFIKTKKSGKNECYVQENTKHYKTTATNHLNNYTNLQTTLQTSYQNPLLSNSNSRECFLFF